MCVTECLLLLSSKPTLSHSSEDQRREYLRMNDIQTLAAGECFLINNALDFASGFRISCILQMSEQKGVTLFIWATSAFSEHSPATSKRQSWTQILVSETQVPPSSAHASAPPVCSIRIILLLERRGWIHSDEQGMVPFPGKETFWMPSHSQDENHSPRRIVSCCAVVCFSDFSKHQHHLQSC